MMVDIAKRFIDSEITSQEMCDEIIRFIMSFHIRKGELEGNEYIIKKITRELFIIYAEYELQTGEIDIGQPFATNKEQLLTLIEAKASEKNYTIFPGK